MDKILLIALGGAIGSVFRYLFSNGVHKILRPSFPYGTLSVNALGCFLIGLLFILLLERFDGMADQFRSFLVIGFLGGFTTFSSFSMETINLLENGDISSAFMNVIVSVLLCLSLTWLGIVVGRLV